MMTVSSSSFELTWGREDWKIYKHGNRTKGRGRWGEGHNEKGFERQSKIKEIPRKVIDSMGRRHPHQEMAGMAPRETCHHPPKAKLLPLKHEALRHCLYSLRGSLANTSSTQYGLCPPECRDLTIFKVGREWPPGLIQTACFHTPVRYPQRLQFAVPALSFSRHFWGIST